MDLRWHGRIGESLLRMISHPPERVARESAAERETTNLSSKLEHHFGPSIYTDFITEKRVLDFGSGTGKEAVTCAAHSAAIVVGVDMEENYLVESRERAHHHDVTNRCRFLHPVKDEVELDRLKGTFDIVYSLDAFEHFSDPDAILKIMESYLAPGGSLLISFGPLWWHPRGSHMDFFTPLPWLQAFFTEKTIMNVRARYRQDGFKTFNEAGLNQMTFARFQKLITNTALEVATFHAVPIRRTKPLAKLPFFREIFTSVIHCRLRKPAAPLRPKFPDVLQAKDTLRARSSPPSKRS